MLVLAVMRRFSNSLLMHWRQSQRRPDHVTTTDFLFVRRSPLPGYALGSGQISQTLKPFMHWRWVGRLREQAGLCLGREVRYKEGVASAFSTLPAALRRGR
jgi:hypothetical protein